MAARPGRVYEELDVAAPYPRGDAFRTSPDYAALCRRASDVLAAAIQLNSGAGHDGH
jgi:NitT/TauT family transport system ATP-binding protein